MYRNLFSFKRLEIKKSFFKARLRARMPGFKLLQSKIEQPDHTNMGKLLIVISRKVGNAVERNKLRRQIKSIFFEEKLYVKPKKSILIVYKEAKDLSFDQIKKFLVKNL